MTPWTSWGPLVYLTLKNEPVLVMLLKNYVYLFYVSIDRWQTKCILSRKFVALIQTIRISALQVLEGDFRIMIEICVSSSMFLLYSPLLDYSSSSAYSSCICVSSNIHDDCVELKYLRSHFQERLKITWGVSRCWHGIWKWTETLTYSWKLFIPGRKIANSYIFKSIEIAFV